MNNLLMNRQTVSLIKMLFILCFLLTACADRREKRSVYVLLDASGTYQQHFDKVLYVVRNILGSLQPGESLALARIDNGSFSVKNIIARMSFNEQPSMANSQKRAFLESVENFAENIPSGQYVDITGGILQAIEYLNATAVDKKYILLLTDLKEDLKQGQLKDFPISFNGTNVITIDINELQSDYPDATEYQQRLQAWSSRVELGNGQWTLVSDLGRLHTLID